MSEVLAVYREPFGIMPTVRRLKAGESLLAMRAKMPCLPEDFDARGTICINGHPAPRALWGAIRPKAPAVTEITFHCPPMGGGKDSGKNILALVASIALTVVTGFVAGGGLATKFGFSSAVFGAGKVGALLAAAGVSLAGSLLLSALIPPPTVPKSPKRPDDPSGASASGNVLEPNGPIPRVVGTFKVFPPLACEPLTYYEGPDEVVEAVYCLAGPHRIEDIRIGAAPIASMTDIEYEVREGWPGDARISLTRRQARTEQLQAELRGHTVSEDDGRTLESSTGDISAALPQVQIVATKDAPDEQLLHVVFPQGLHQNASETNKMRVPIRLRMRAVGATTWIDLPELHFQAANIRQLRAAIRLIWTDDASTTPGAPNAEGWVEARIAAPGQTNAPAQPDWAADGYFDKGAGDDYLTGSNLGSTAVDHVILSRYEAAIYLDTATFPKGRYEIEIKRGAAIRTSSYSVAAYTYGGTVWDLFGYQGTPGRLPLTRDGIADSLYLVRSISVWNAHPVPTDDLAVIAIRARNRQLDAISCVAGGYVLDWDGSGWNTWTVTDNPAPHLRDVYIGALNLDPVPGALIDETGLVSWRTACASLGYRCNAIIEGKTVDEATRIIAACGYAKPYLSEIIGVTRDYDRSAEAPVQIFTPRNSSGFQWTKAFPRVPDGFRVNFRDKDRDYESRQITVYRAGASDDSGLLEQVTYEGLTTEAEARARAEYDQRQPELRGTFYSLDVPPEAIVCRRGDLVGVTHDMLSAQRGAGRVIGFEEDAGEVTAILLDEEVPVFGEADVHAVADWHAVRDLHALGRSSGVALRRSGGTVTVHPLANATGETDRLELAAPISGAGIAGGSLATVGLLGQEFARMIVFAIRPKPNLEASLTLVDEAQELWA